MGRNELIHQRIEKALKAFVKIIPNSFYRQVDIADRYRQEVVGWKWVAYFECDRKIDGSVDLVPVLEHEGRRYRGDETSELITGWCAR